MGHLMHVEELLSGSLRDVFSDHGRPPLLLLSFSPILEMSEEGTRLAACCCKAQPRCGDPGCDPFRILRSDDGSVMEDWHGMVLRRYGITELSVRNVVVSSLRDRVHSAMGLSECEYAGTPPASAGATRKDPVCALEQVSHLQHARAALLFSDFIHPRPRMSLLVSDALMLHFADAQRALAQAGGPTFLHTTAWPEAPLHPAAAEFRPRRCFSVDGKFKLPVHPVPGTPPFSYFATEEVRGEKVPKPGWIGAEPGASMELKFSSQFSRTPAEAPAEVSLAFLRSYENMGIARVECSFGCSCSPIEVNAHDASHRVSVEDTANVAVSQHPACRLRLKILNETTSGHHKWKLMGVTITGPQRRSSLSSAVTTDLRASSIIISAAVAGG